MRAASPPRQMERENEMIVISHRLFACVKKARDAWMGSLLYKDFRRWEIISL
jgi:hypothetical protein